MLNTGIFQEQLKISKVVPLYKANDQTLLTNYRPIALLPSISKIFECAILEQLSNYFLGNELFALQQFGFRAKHSTELAVLNLVDYLTYKLDAGKIQPLFLVWLACVIDIILLFCMVSMPLTTFFCFQFHIIHHLLIWLMSK